ncbi:cytochrome P450 2U1 [Elysia marginata]|uniref:Cytochrome P450 2U1 n=1 Tax=Elysia marginata TaxID=1093978 RepID=A0AAV4FLX7_9GAST|nr:cytochrome P450 2U1 [Elysia marginata]
MPRLSEVDRHRALGLLQAGLPISEVSLSMNVDRTTNFRLRQHLHETDTVSDRLRSGRPRCATHRQDRNLVRNHMNNRFLSASASSRHTRGRNNQRVSVNRVRRRLSTSGLRARRQYISPILSQRHRHQRTLWAQEHAAWDRIQWRSVVFRDESRLCIDHADGRVRVWRRSGERYQTDCDREHDSSEENLSRVLFSLFIAGTDSVSTTITWFMLHMLHSPDVQAKMFAEISEVVGTARAPDMHDKSKLNFTLAAITEALRLAAPPLGPPHLCKEATEIRGYTIPAGTAIFSNFDSMFRTDSEWKDPNKYNPDRFLNADGKFSQPVQFTPFGIGSFGMRTAMSFDVGALYLLSCSLQRAFSLITMTYEP